MMHPADEVLLPQAITPSHIVDTDGPCMDQHPERRMIFHTRPDLSGRHVLFQNRNRTNGKRATQQQPTPVQFLTIDGRSHLGMSVPDQTSSSAFAADIERDDDKLPRILVSTSPLTDAASQIRLRHLQLAILAAAVVNVLVTVMFLYPASTDAWYFVDTRGSPSGYESAHRVKAVRPTLLLLAVLSNIFLVAATFLKMDALITVYISALVALDIWSLVLLLPHALFLLRFLLDALLIGIALEVRTHLEHAWFLTSFHRLRTTATGH